MSVPALRQIVANYGTNSQITSNQSVVEKRELVSLVVYVFQLHYHVLLSMIIGVLLIVKRTHRNIT